MPLRFALNRTCAPQLALPEFIALAKAVGVQAVEIRNDIEGREFADGTPAAEIKARLAGMHQRDTAGRLSPMAYDPPQEPHHFLGGGGLFRAGGGLLNNLVHFRHSLINLKDALRLLARGGRNLFHKLSHLAGYFHIGLEGLAGFKGHLLRAFDRLNGILNESGRIFGGRRRAHRQIAHLVGDDGKARPRLTGSGRLHCGV